MRKAKILLGLGIWIALLSFLGFPQSYKNILFSLSGLGVIYASYILYRENKGEKSFENFSENQSWGMEEEVRNEI